MWSANCYTDVGNVRRLNEDALLDRGGEGLWLVADGMGGHAKGDVASRLVADTLASFRQNALPGVSKFRLTRALDACNAALIDKAIAERAGVIGCTVAALRIQGRQCYCSWSGDSRIYRLRDGRLTCLTRDHSRRALYEDSDVRHRDDWYSDEGGEILTAAIGGNPQLFLEHCCYGVRTDDRFLICTDGLYKEVDESEMADALSRESSGEAVLHALATLYRQRGARDNIAMLLIDHHAGDDTHGSRS